MLLKSLQDGNGCVASRLLWPSTWRHYVPSKRHWISVRLHGVTSQKIALIVVTSLRTSSLVSFGLQPERFEAETAPTLPQSVHHVTCKVSSLYKMSCFWPQFSDIEASLHLGYNPERMRILTECLLKEGVVIYKLLDDRYRGVWRECNFVRLVISFMPPYFARNPNWTLLNFWRI